MTYLIMMGCSFFFLVTCLVFCFIPIFTIDRYPISYLIGSSAEYKYSILDILDQPKALVSLILVILSVILVFIMLIKAFKVFDSAKYTRSYGDYFFSIVSTICVLVFAIFVFLLYTSHAEVEATEGYYAYYKNHLVTFILLVIFGGLAFICNIVAFVIKTLNMFVSGIDNKKFFKMTSEKAKEIKVENKSKSQAENDLSIEKIEVLEKLYTLKEKGIISEEEFNERKSKLIS